MAVLKIFFEGIVWENLLVIVQALIGLRLIWYLIGTLVLIWEERESKTAVGQLRIAVTGKMLRIHWGIVIRKLVKWAIIFVVFVFYREIFEFIGIGKFLVGAL